MTEYDAMRERKRWGVLEGRGGGGGAKQYLTLSAQHHAWSMHSSGHERKQQKSIYVYMRKRNL